jgi:hypothetical protein
MISNSRCVDKKDDLSLPVSPYHVTLRHVTARHVLNG